MSALLRRRFEAAMKARTVANLGSAIYEMEPTVSAMAQAGLQASKLGEMRVIEDIWREGMQYFTLTGALGWQKILGLALIPACLLALRNAFNAFEQFHAWVHGHKAALHDPKELSQHTTIVPARADRNQRHTHRAIAPLIHCCRFSFHQFAMQYLYAFTQ